MNATGRPTKLDDLTAKRIVDAIRAGNTRACAAQLGGVHKATLLEWLALGRRGEQPFADFADRVAKADGEAEARMVAVVVKAAEDGSWQAAKAWLELRRRVWRMKKPRQELDEQDLSGKSEEELVAVVEQWLSQRKQMAGSP